MLQLAQSGDATTNLGIDTHFDGEVVGVEK